jgi:omega-amidase
MASLRVALCQILPNIATKETAFAAASASVAAAADAGASLAVLPEMWSCAYSTDAMAAAATELTLDGSAPLQPAPGIATWCSDLAKKHSLTLVAGSFPERVGDRVYNTALVFDAQGCLVARHRKVHLFDIDIPGGQRFRESDTLSAGDALTTFDANGLRIALGICYDVRFAAAALAVRRSRDVDMFIYPGAFNPTTGPLHWELLMRARAVDNQSFVLGCAPARDPDATYQSHGHSILVDPWGAVIDQASDEPALLVADLDLPQLAKVRQAIPISTQERSDLYQVRDMQQHASSPSTAASPP